MDLFEKFKSGLTSPPSKFFDVTTSDTVDLAVSTRFIMVAVAGNVKITGVGDADDAPVVLPALAAGVWHKVRAKRIWAIGTAATGIVGAY